MTSEVSDPGTSVGIWPAVSGFGSSTVVASTSPTSSPSAGTPSSNKIPPAAVAEVGAGPASGIERDELINTTATTIAITAAITPTIVDVTVRERRFSAAN